MARVHVPEADEGILAAVFRACPHPTLSRKRERGKSAGEGAITKGIGVFGTLHRPSRVRTP